MDMFIHAVRPVSLAPFAGGSQFVAALNRVHRPSPIKAEPSVVPAVSNAADGTGAQDTITSRSSGESVGEIYNSRDAALAEKLRRVRAARLMAPLRQNAIRAYNATMALLTAAKVEDHPTSALEPIDSKIVVLEAQARRHLQTIDALAA